MIRNKRLLASILILVMTAGLHGLAQGKRALAPNVADVSVETDGVLIQPKAEFDRITVTVNGPDGTYKQTFSGGESFALDLFNADGEMLADGFYKFELVATPFETLRNSSEDNGRGAIETKRHMDYDREDFFQSGYFTIAEGEFVLPRLGETLFKDGEQTRNGNTNTSSGTDQTKPTGGSTETYPVPDLDEGTRDQQILDDLIVVGSICAGLDCSNGESFGFDTLRLKENNLRIKAQDTSNSASFPTNDWQITFNDSTNGGANKFSIDDIDGGRTPFTIEASAPSHSLYVDDGGRIGLGTSTPVVELHVVNGDSPTLRLEQDGSSGFTPQTWDVAGNETNFFVRDATNGSRLPFKIRPSAPTNSIYVDTDGDVGLGTASPSAQLDIVGGGIEVNATDSTGALTIIDTGVDVTQDMIILENAGYTNMTMRNTTTNTQWDFSTSGSGFAISLDGSGGQELLIAESGRVRMGAGNNTFFDMLSNGNTTFTQDLTVDGTFSNPSDRNLKEEFEVVDTRDVLEKIAAMPITTWSYKRDEDKLRHMGPMAQDFYAAFGLGKDERYLTNVDTDGVSFAAIQGLNLKVEEKQAEIDQLKQENQDLEARLEALENLVNSLVKKNGK